MANFILVDEDYNILNLIVCESKELAKELFNCEAIEYDPISSLITMDWKWNGLSFYDPSIEV